MEPEVFEALKILGFKDIKKLPKLREIMKNWRKLSMEKHPDKNGGTPESTREFQELLDAYQTAGDACEKIMKEKTEYDDLIAQKLFSQFQFSSVKENSNSFTIKTEKQLNDIWCEILKVSLGLPEDKGNNGKKFIYVDECETPAKVTLTLYKTGSLLVQAEKCHHALNIHFVNTHLPDLYSQVYNREKLQLKCQKTKTPLRKPTSSKRLASKTQTCNKCEFTCVGTVTMLAHIKKKHGNFRALKSPTTVIAPTAIIEEPKQLINVVILDDTPNPTALERSSETLIWNCMLCGEEFTNKSLLDLHVKDFHEELCSQCSIIFYTKYDLNVHEKESHTPSTSIDTICPSQNDSSPPQTPGTVSKLRQLQTFTCDVCEYTTGIGSLMNAHVESSHLKCCTCEETIKNHISCNG